MKKGAFDLYSTTSNYVYHKLRNRILTKKIKPGQHLPEIALAKELDVSRTPVREALRKLADEGLVKLVPNVGARLLDPTKEEIEGIWEMRKYLEILAVRKASHRITPLQFCLLEEELQKEERSFAAKDLQACLDVNSAFHRIIAEASGNAVLAEYVENVLKRSYAYMVFYDSFFDLKTSPSLDGHRAIAEALSNHDEELSVKLMEDHLRTAISDLSEKQTEDEIL